ncbi:hypothetical protein EMIHUDRAFT_207613 [Emiliania huxleyi CCMP1516]|uniref:Uncharacterized protein n=2 Tax=Emiliania huxleyi TaxID=2903 RepID=A0A0D3JDQ9_EMIH1|nr:hypothetical protein EMIHUDRAFT_207613 [Emiliania huxleyi CCMP1516]EOD21644.1 hypothetical protein EMIHUDRAFT_207613 [Emiliania huxleyi CCMP1516]|eukprot:XP_005774073.1 hypothetical protein EMIHUDRAFT_207613 [Emiliania huxleyi CCMP1516]
MRIGYQIALSPPDDAEARPDWSALSDGKGQSEREVNYVDVAKPRNQKAKFRAHLLSPAEKNTLSSPLYWLPLRLRSL